VSGTITLHTGAAPTSGTLATISFAGAYGAVPNVVMTPVGNSSATIQYSVNTVSSTNFTLGSANAPTGGTSYMYAYHVEQ
jgi:hypothetical protein